MSLQITPRIIPYNAGSLERLANDVVENPYRRLHRDMSPFVQFLADIYSRNAGIKKHSSENIIPLDLGIKIGVQALTGCVDESPDNHALTVKNKLIVINNGPFNKERRKLAHTIDAIVKTGTNTYDRHPEFEVFDDAIPKATEAIWQDHISDGTYTEEVTDIAWRSLMQTVVVFDHLVGTEFDDGQSRRIGMLD